MTNHLPLTISISESGAVALDAPTRVVCMSRFSERAGRLAAHFGAGITVLSTDQDITETPAAVLVDLNGALDV